MDDYSYHYYDDLILSHLQWSHDEGLSISAGKDDSRYGRRCVALTRWWVSSGTTTPPFYRYNHKCLCTSCLVHCRWSIQCCKSIRQIPLMISLMVVTSFHMDAVHHPLSTFFQLFPDPQHWTEACPYTCCHPKAASKVIKSSVCKTLCLPSITWRLFECWKKLNTLKQEWLLAFWNKIHTHKRLKRMLSITVLGVVVVVIGF